MSRRLIWALLVLIVICTVAIGATVATYSISGENQIDRLQHRQDFRECEVDQRTTFLEGQWRTFNRYLEDQRTGDEQGMAESLAAMRDAPSVAQLIATHCKGLVPASGGRLVPATAP